MRRWLQVAVLMMVPGLLGVGSLAADEKVSDANLRVFRVLQAGTEAGELSYRWTTAESGNLFGFSNMDLKRKKGSYLVRTHIQLRPDGTVEKYKKWIGNEGADPDLAVFWKGTKLRIVKKGKRSFAKNVSVPQAFVTVDHAAPFLHQEVVRELLKAGKDLSLQAMNAPEGAMSRIEARRAGTCALELPNAAAQELILVEISGADQAMLCVDNKGELWWLQNKETEFIRKGATVTAGKGVSGAAPAAVEPDVEPEAEPSSKEGKAPAPSDHKPLPD